MLMTKLKSEEVIGSLTSGKVFIINCHGCKEVGFPEAEAKALQDRFWRISRCMPAATPSSCPASRA